MTGHDSAMRPADNVVDASSSWQQAIEIAQPETARTLGEHRHGLYVHVPYCASRCGYCDFNTYTPQETDLDVGVYLQAAIREIRCAKQYWRAPRVDTVFIGGGTPTMLSATDLGSILDTIDSVFGLSADAEITVEVNPDSVTAQTLKQLRVGGFTRASFGVQSLAPHVLAVLERTHTPGRSLAAIDEAHDAGFEHVSADIMYATPGETDADLAHTVTSVLTRGVDHVSAYSLIVEPGTRLARQVRTGAVSMPEDDVAADRYELIDALARQQGLEWYEVSNWSLPGGQCRHNMGYWRNHDWWAVGPGAHGHVGGIRWVNAKHPRAYTERITAHGHAMVEWEQVSDTERHLEQVMLGLRLGEGLSREVIAASHQHVVEDEIVAGNLRPAGDRLVLTDRGRLFADAIARRLTP